MKQKMADYEHKLRYTASRIVEKAVYLLFGSATELTRDEFMENMGKSEILK
jgi:hypothetical protein